MCFDVSNEIGQKYLAANVLFNNVYECKWIPYSKPYF